MMKSHLKSALLASAAIMLAAQAQAFDTVDWNWDADVQTQVTQTIDVTAELDATGLGMVENEQVFIGSASASSDVTALTVTPSVPLNGLGTDDLARVESAGTAVGNNGSIESDVKTDVDSSQLTGGAEIVDPLTGLVSVGAPAVIAATSTVSGITNAQVDSSATGVGNNLTIDVTPGTGDAILVANNVQTTYADIASVSSVSTVTVSDYSGLGGLSDPLVGSAATAVGNNLDVSVAGSTGGF
ncbi:hypothetical protein LNKW23_16720 [Paralimibaculum aggregatum]|uniref:Uncharacterized protein n=1 Tax=Paralimibaculum aggregatum TaxID=3036245 RepID=A0ABQ6LGL8_9RHOB|nr:hypothetical protein [Limibaculum sp. NKW23]GMG82459.1 hypothetical protein LNKW23_16720 [Limibaculum sp. NKW23]